MFKLKMLRIGVLTTLLIAPPSAFAAASGVHPIIVAPIVMVNLPAGKLVMGCVSKRDDVVAACDYDEFPAHQVQIPAFQMSRYEVTLGQWRAIMGDLPIYPGTCNDNCPVGNVSWEAAQVFIQRLNQKTASNFRLPTEAEWEYACRAGENHAYCGGNQLDALAWHEDNSGLQAHPVGQKKPNAFGLYDMTGNVWEWVQDCRHTNYINAPKDGSAWTTACEGDRIRIRGGGWDAQPKYLRPSLRVALARPVHFYYTGLRLARSIKR